MTVAHAQNFTTYDLIVPVSSTAVLTTVDGIGRILPTNRSYVIGIDGGTRGAIVFQDWTASAEYPLIIVNRTGTGKVVVTDVGGATKRDGIAIKNCKYFQLRGDNDPAYRYGIEVAQVGSKVGHSHLGVAVGGASSDGEIMFVEVHDSGFAGIMVKSDPSCANPATWASNFVMNNISVHDNYVHDTGGEGMYLGYTHWPEPETCGAFGHEIHHLRVSYNLVANTGWESIQVASNPVDTRLFENVMFQAGLTPDSSGQGSNLQIGGGATGEYFNNVMIGAFYNNVSCTGQEGNVSVYNNLMAGALDYGIFAKNLPEPPPADPDARQTVPGSYVNFFNNTIVNPAHAAYYTLDHVSVNSFKNNICVIPNTAFTEVLTGNGAVVNTAGNVLVRDTTTLAFVNESEKDYRILPASAAANVGVSLAGLPSPQISVTTDFEGKARPQGAAYDAGWNETGALSVYLIATPPSTTGGTGSIKASAIGGATPYTYVWSNSASTQTISGVSQGLYSVTVIDAVGAAVTKAVYLKDLAALGAPVRVTPPNEVLSPVLSPASGSFATSQIVTLNSGTAGSSIRYTTDGSIPTATTGTVYSGSILAANTTVVKAVAYKAGMDSSVLSTGTYIINNGPANAKFTGIVTTESAHSSSNVVARTLDGDLATSWGSNGDGNWVKYDLNAPQRLAFVSIAFPSGDVRTYTFDLQVSTDNTTWTDVLPGHKSPRALGLQVYDIPDIDPVRYVRIVCHGSTYNAGLNSIAEVEIWGGAASSAVAPAITTQPQSQTVSSGNNVALNVVATGAPSPTYQWRKNGTNLVGATSSTYNLVNVQPGDSGSYSVVVTNSSGSITSGPATLTVGTPASLGIFQAENATLSGALVKSNQTGYTGTGFADYINLAGDYVEWSVSNPVSSSRTFTFRYASTGLARNLSITVNGVVVNGALAFATTGGANIWVLKTMTVSLPAGTVLIRATATGTSGPNVDYLQID